jgi:hypothetical protein
MADAAPDDATADPDSDAEDATADNDSDPGNAAAGQDSNADHTAASVPDRPSAAASIREDAPADDDSVIDGDAALSEPDARHPFDSLQQVVHRCVADLLDEIAGDGPRTTFGMTEVTEVAQIEPVPAGDCDCECDTDESLALALAAFRREQRLPPLSMQVAIIDYVRRKSLEFVVAEKYDAAERMDDVASELIAAYSGNELGGQLQTRAKEIKTRIFQVQQERRSMCESLSARIATLEDEKHAKLAELTETHERERAEFAKECESPKFLSRFTKPSPQLLQLRMTQKRLALAKDFDGAKAAKARADELHVAESVVASKRATDSVRLLYGSLLERQQKEITGAEGNSKRKIADVRAEMKRQSDAFGKLLRQLEGKLKEARTKKLPRRLSPKLVVPSPAHKKMAEFRRAVELPQLEIRIDMKAILANVGK